MFGLFKKNSKPELKPDKETSLAPFEILLPVEITRGQAPDLRIASKLLHILCTNSNNEQTLEIFEGIPVVNSNNAQLKEFANIVNGAKQTAALKNQIDLMCFAPKQAGSIGILCCLVNGILNEFHIDNHGGGATLNYQFTRVIHTKA